MIIKMLLTASVCIMVLAAACGGSEASTANTPDVPDSIDKSTAASPPAPENIMPTVLSPRTPIAASAHEGDLAEALAHFEAGVALQEKEHLEEAIAEYDQALRFDPQLVIAYNNRGLSYGNMGQYLRAIEDFDEAIRLNPKYALAYNNRGRAYNTWASTNAPSRATTQPSG